MAGPDRVTRRGIIVFEGEELDPLSLDAAELKNLESRLIQDKEILSTMLQRQDLAEDLRGTSWKEEVKLKIRTRKRQLDAIQAEYTRRKEITPSIETYAFKAVLQLYGEEGLKEVEKLARKLRNEDASLPERDKSYLEKEYGLRKAMCDTKIKYKVKREAVDAIEYMKARGRNVSGLQAYRCPFCRQWHVGHKPVKWRDPLPGDEKSIRRRMGQLSRMESN